MEAKTHNRIETLTPERPLVAVTGSFIFPRHWVRRGLEALGFKVISTPRQGAVLIVGRDPGSKYLAARARSVPCYTLARFALRYCLGRV